MLVKNILLLLNIGIILVFVNAKGKNLKALCYNAKFPITENKINTFGVIKNKLTPCHEHVSKLQDEADKIHQDYNEVHEDLTDMKDDMDELKSNFDKMKTVTDKAMKFAKRVPKIGKILDMVVRIIIPKIDRFLTSTQKRINKVHDVSKKIDKAFSTASSSSGYAETGYSSALSFSKDYPKYATIAKNCAAKTSSCTDDSSLETMSRYILTNPFVSMVNTCNDVEDMYNKMLEIEKTIQDRVKKTIENMVKSLAPIISVINDIIEEIHKICKMITDLITEAYCCNTPLLAQLGIDAITKVIDLATCPAGPIMDGMSNEVMKSLSTMLRMFGNNINGIFDPLENTINSVAGMGIDYLSFTGSFGVNKCSLVSVPLPTKKSWQLFSKIDLSMTFEPLYDPEFNLFESLKTECGKALDSFNDWEKSNCCKEFRPAINDGAFCDPSESIATNGCSMCKSNMNQFWYGPFHQACGKEPCWGDGSKCALGSSCDRCCRSATYWPGKVFTACGKEPCWGDGSHCGKGTTCNQCCRSATYWAGKAFTACGKEPCWGKGTKCGMGTTCNACCKGAECPWYWFGVCKCK